MTFQTSMDDLQAVSPHFARSHVAPALLAWAFRQTITKELVKRGLWVGNFRPTDSALREFVDQCGVDAETLVSDLFRALEDLVSTLEWPSQPAERTVLLSRALQHLATSGA